MDNFESDQPRDATSRQLVSVFTNSSLPTCTPCLYLGNPVTLGSPETEGGTESPSIDTSTVLPFVLIRGTAAVGDLLPVHATGGRWVAEKSGCTTTICVVCLSAPVSGASVAIFQGPTRVSSGTTGSNGCVTLPIPSAGTYTVVATSTSGNRTGSYSLACNGTTTIELCLCCSGCIPKTDLTLTVTGVNGDGSDYNGSCTLTMGPLLCTWSGSLPPFTGDPLLCDCPPLPCGISCDGGIGLPQIGIAGCPIINQTSLTCGSGFLWTGNFGFGPFGSICEIFNCCPGAGLLTWTVSR